MHDDDIPWAGPQRPWRVGRLPRKVFDAIPTELEPFDLRAARDLERFSWCVAELAGARLLGPEHAQLAVVLAPEGVCFGSLDHEQTMEAFESLCVRFRRIWAKGEPNIDQVRRLLGRNRVRETGAVTGWLKGLGVRTKAHHRTWTTGQFWVRSASGSREELTPARALDLVFNGEIFHTEPEKASRLRDQGNWRVGTMGVLYHQIAALALVSQELAVAVERVLGEPTLVPPDYLAFRRLTAREGA